MQNWLCTGAWCFLTLRLAVTLTATERNAGRNEDCNDDCDDDWTLHVMLAVTKTEHRTIQC